MSKYPPDHRGRLGHTLGVAGQTINARLNTPARVSGMAALVISCVARQWLFFPHDMLGIDQGADHFLDEEGLPSAFPGSGRERFREGLRR